MVKGISWMMLLAAIILVIGCENNPNGIIVTSISGTISYNGIYGGQNRTIYIRGYKEDNRAVGEPDLVTSIINTGDYELDLNEYKGEFYISAFMDIDETGNQNGPSANDTLINGVYSDPLGCYGDYTFESGGPVKIIIAGEEKDIDFELFDSGVIKASLPDTGHCTFGVIKNHTISDEFLHHIHCNVVNTGDFFLLPVPAKEGWYCKVKFNSEIPQLYPDSINVLVNSIVEINF